jgi:hypothetical protein
MDDFQTKAMCLPGKAELVKERLTRMKQELYQKCKRALKPIDDPRKMSRRLSYFIFITVKTTR